jgi:hypothetical protein
MDNQVYVVTFVYTCCVNIRLTLILIPTYVELLQPKISTDSYICLGVKNGFQNQFLMVQIFVVSHNFHVRNYKDSHHPKPSPAFWMV